MDDLTARQLELLRAIAELDPPLHVFGGYAEDALLTGTVTRPHADVDVVFPRREHELRRDQLRRLGFTDFEVWGEAAPGEPFYLYGERDGLKLECGISDEVGGRNYVRVYRLAFEIGGKPAPAGYGFALPDDMYAYPAALVDGVSVHPISPLALHQIRMGIASQGSFGELSERQLQAAEQLHARFFADLDPRPQIDVL